jgi:hypothetical protein
MHTYFLHHVSWVMLNLAATNIRYLININIAITILDIIHRPLFYLKQRFGDWFVSVYR